MYQPPQQQPPQWQPPPKWQQQPPPLWQQQPPSAQIAKHDLQYPHWKIGMTICFVLSTIAYLVALMSMLQIYTLVNASRYGLIANAQAIGSSVVVIFAAMIFGQFFIACGLVCMMLAI